MSPQVAVGQFVFALYQLAVQFNQWPVLSIMCGRHFYICGLGVTRPLLITQVIQSKNKLAHCHSGKSREKTEPEIL